MAPKSADEPKFPGVPSDSLALKLKLREVSAALKAMTNERDALERARAYQGSSEGDATLSDLPGESEITPQASKANIFDQSPTLDSPASNLKEENEAFQSQLNHSANSLLALKELVSSFKSENEALSSKNRELLASQSGYLQETQYLKDQVASLVQDVHSLTDENERHKLQFSEKSKQNTSRRNSATMDPARHEARDSVAAYEFRISSLQQKITELEIERDKALSTVDAQSPTLVHIPLVDQADYQRLNQQVIEMSDDRAQFELKINEKKCEIRKLKESNVTHSKNIEICNKNIARLEKLLEGKKSSYQRLQAERDLLLEKTSTLSDRLKSLKRLKMIAPSDVNNYNCRELALEIETLKAQVIESEAKQATLARDNDQRIANNEAAEKQLVASELQISVETSRSTKLEAEIEKVKDTTSAQISKFVTRLKSNAVEMEKMKQETAQLEDALAEKQLLQEEVALLAKQCEGFQAKILQLENSGRAEKSDAQYDEQSSVLKLLNEATLQIKELKASSAKKEKELRSCERKCKELSTTIEDLTAMQFESSNELNALRTKRDEVMASEETLKKDKSALVDNIGQLEANIKKQKAEIAIIADQLNFALDKATSDKQIHEGKEKQLTIEIAEHSYMIEKLKAEKSKASTEVETECNRQLEALMAEMAELRSQATNYNTLKETVRSLQEDLECKNEAYLEAVARSDRAPDLTTSTIDSSSLEILVDQLKAEKEAAVQKLSTSNSIISQLEITISGQHSSLANLQKQLGEETETKTKSIQLLRHSKNRILKLEVDLKEKTADAEGILGKLSAANHSLQQVSEMKDELTIQLNRCRESLEIAQVSIKGFERQISQLQNDLDRELSTNEALMQNCVEKDDRIVVMSSRLEQMSSVSQSEVDVLRRESRLMKGQLNDWPLKMKDYEIRLESLDQELSTSKRLFETKSIENDQMKLRISELEVSEYESTKALQKQLDKAANIQQDASMRKAEILELLKQVKHLEAAVEESKKVDKHKQGSDEKQILDFKLIADELSTLKLRYNTLLAKYDEAVSNISSYQHKQDISDEKLKKLAEERVSWSNEKDRLISDFRIRESQLKNISKSLKTELRKFTRHPDSPISSVENSPMVPTSRTSRFEGATSIDTAFRKVLSRRESTVALSPTAASPLMNSTETRNEELPAPNPEYLKAVVLKYIESRDKRVNTYLPRAKC